jgi:peptide/nickel transport system substrate-binding protein
MLVDDVVAIPIGVRGEVFGAGKDLEGIDLTPWDAETWNIGDWKRASP